MGGMGSIFAAVLGVIWIIAASAMTRGAGIFGVIFPLFGVAFVVFAIIHAVYDFRNATSKNRYSEFDIVDENEESEPLNNSFGGGAEFCRYCGSKINDDFEFCPKCGKKLPQQE